ncbi:MAG: NYN domain-containing protein [Verrucomicrobiota bacterium]
MPQTKKYLLVDGHSFLFQIQQWRKIHDSNPSLARESLIQKMQVLQDTSDWLITLVYDGKHGSPQAPEPGKIAVLYSSQNATADSIIEKIVAAHKHPQQITIVTADRAEQHTVESLGAFSLSPEWLQDEISFTDDQFRETMKHVKKKSQW